MVAALELVAVGTLVWTVPARALRRFGAADRTTAGADVDLVQDVRVLPEFGGHLHDDVVLVLRGIDHRYLSLAEGVVERIVDLADGKPKARAAAARSITRSTSSPFAAGRD